MSLVLRYFIFSIAGVAIFFSQSALSSEVVRKEIQIDITTHLGDVRDFKNGDEVSFLISINRSSNVLVLYRSANGHLIQLLPNRIQKRFYLNSGIYLPIPNKNAPYIFKIQPPFGKEVLWVFASDSEFPELEGKERIDGTKNLKDNIKSIRKIIMSLPSEYYGEKSYQLITRP